jgi:hypothetical protein
VQEKAIGTCIVQYARLRVEGKTASGGPAEEFSIVLIYEKKFKRRVCVSKKYMARTAERREGGR